MKLTELAAPNLTKQLTQVFESYFGKRVPFATVTSTQARSMLQRVRGLLREHRAQPAFHISERNPAYLKLIMLEQGLTSKLREEISPIAPTAPTTPAKPIDPKLLAAQKKLTAKQPLTPEEQLIINASVIANESRRRTLYNILRESEIQQAQVVLASQDMVDRVQNTPLID